MPRIRNIRPEFWADKMTQRLSFVGRLLYIGMWNFADDNGILEDDASELKARIFPSDSTSAQAISSLLEQLEKLQRILRYQRGNKSYILVIRFSKHQSPQHPHYLYPLPNPLPHYLKTEETAYGVRLTFVGDQLAFTDNSVNAPITLSESSHNQGTVNDPPPEESKSAEMPDFILPLHGLLGFHRPGRKAVSVITTACAQHNVDPRTVATDFAEYYPVGRLKHGWTNPVRALVNTLDIQIEKTLRRLAHADPQGDPEADSGPGKWEREAERLHHPLR